MLLSDWSQNPLIVVTGPARSGKSEWAEHLAQQMRQPVTYLATAQTLPDDADWQARILRHQQRRPADWQTWEVPIDVAAVIAQTNPGTCVLIDSLGTWLVNQLDQAEPAWQRSVQDLVQSLSLRHNPVIVVAEEVGWGVVPAYASGQLFRDRLGTVTRQISALADAVYLVVAGYAVDVQQLGTRVPIVPASSGNLI